MAFTSGLSLYFNNCIQPELDILEALVASTNPQPSRETHELSASAYYEQFEHRAEDPRVNCCEHPQHHTSIEVALKPCPLCESKPANSEVPF